MAKMKPLHPGEVPVNRITGIVNEDRAITADTALRLSRYFGTSAKIWTGLQADYDLELAKANNSAALKRIETANNSHA